MNTPAPAQPSTLPSVSEEIYFIGACMFNQFVRSPVGASLIAAWHCWHSSHAEPEGIFSAFSDCVQAVCILTFRGLWVLAHGGHGCQWRSSSAIIMPHITDSLYWVARPEDRHCLAEQWGEAGWVINLMRLQVRSVNITQHSQFIVVPLMAAQVQAARTSCLDLHTECVLG